MKSIAHSLGGHRKDLPKIKPFNFYFGNVERQQMDNGLHFIWVMFDTKKTKNKTCFLGSIQENARRTTSAGIKLHKFWVLIIVPSLRHPYGLNR